MTFVVTEACIRCKYTDCVDVCPEGANFLVIDPDDCIDCALCVPEYPVGAIFAQEDVPADQQTFTPLNAELARVWKPITMTKAALPDADEWAKVDAKRLSSSADHGSSPRSRWPQTPSAAWPALAGPDFQSLNAREWCPATTGVQRVALECFLQHLDECTFRDLLPSEATLLPPIGRGRSMPKMIGARPACKRGRAACHASSSGHRSQLLIRLVAPCGQRCSLFTTHLRRAAIFRRRAQVLVIGPPIDCAWHRESQVPRFASTAAPRAVTR